MWKISDAIKDLRESFGLTPKDLADMLNVSVRTIYNYENGSREPSLSTVQELSKIFNVSVDYLMNGYAYVDTDKGTITIKFKSGKKTKLDLDMMQDFISQLENNKIDAESLIKELKEESDK